MHVPLSWLREYVTVNATATEMADRLFTSAAQVERVFDVGEGTRQLRRRVRLPSAAPRSESRTKTLAG